MTTSWSTPRALLSLWTAVLLAPLAWALQLSLNYAFASFACEGAWTLSFHVATVVALALSVAGGLLSWSLWQKLRHVSADKDGLRSVRSRFMALAGLAFSVFFGLAIIAQWLPTLFIEPCRF